MAAEAVTAVAAILAVVVTLVAAVISVAVILAVDTSGVGISRWPHFGGGHFGGGHFGGGHFGGMRRGGTHFGGGGATSVAGPRSARSGFAGNRSFAGRNSAGNLAGRNASIRSAAVRRALRSRAVAGALHNRGALRNPRHPRANRGERGNGGAGEPAGWELAGWDSQGGWWRHGNGGYGWVGPLFWPFAFYDISDYAMWGYGYDPSFWGYGYGDIYAGLFAPYGYDDLTGYLPQGGGGYSGGAAPAPSAARQIRHRMNCRKCAARTAGTSRACRSIKSSRLFSQTTPSARRSMISPTLR